MHEECNLPFPIFLISHFIHEFQHRNLSQGEHRNEVSPGGILNQSNTFFMLPLTGFRSHNHLKAEGRKGITLSLHPLGQEVGVRNPAVIQNQGKQVV